MIIHIEDLKFQCIIGILDFERVTEQDVVINATVDYNYQKNFINYADLAKYIKFIMIKNEFLLIEDAIETINLNLIKEYNSIKSINLKITKPSVLSDCKVSVSSYYESQS